MVEFPAMEAQVVMIVQEKMIKNGLYNCTIQTPLRFFFSCAAKIPMKSIATALKGNETENSQRLYGFLILFCSSMQQKKDVCLCDNRFFKTILKTSLTLVVES